MSRAVIVVCSIGLFFTSRLRSGLLARLFLPA